MNNTSNCFLMHGVYAGKLELDYGIKPTDKVLDIGGGNQPFVHATHVLDDIGTDFETQRHGFGLHIGINQTLIRGTTEKLPEFADNYFDFIHCSHLLEHVSNLPDVLEEISRVGKRGYVAVPHCLYDAWSANVETGHVWFCDYDYTNDIFLIRKRKENEYIKYIPKLWNTVMWGGNNDEWRDAFEGHDCGGLRVFWEIRFFWEDKIDYVVDDTIIPQMKLFLDMLQQAKEKRDGT